MPIDIKLNVMLAQRKVKSKDLAAAIGITEQNLSLLKQGKVKGFRLSTLEAICKHLDCQPGDILTYSTDAPDSGRTHKDGAVVLKLFRTGK